MTDRYFTFVIVPETSIKVKKIRVRSPWIFLGGLFFAAVGMAVLLAIVEYSQVMGQIKVSQELVEEKRMLVSQLASVESRLREYQKKFQGFEVFAQKLENVIIHQIEFELENALTRSVPLADSNRMMWSKWSVEGLNRDFIWSSPGSSVLDQQIDFLGGIYQTILNKGFEIENRLQHVQEMMTDQREFLEVFPNFKPASGITASGFGVRTSAFSGELKMHEGVDIANYRHTAVYAAGKGVIKTSETRPGYGKLIIIEHGYGLETWYAHLDELLFTQGTRVEKGQIIGRMGNSGRTSGIHLHYEVRSKGIPVDPLNYIF